MRSFKTISFRIKSTLKYNRLSEGEIIKVYTPTKMNTDNHTVNQKYPQFEKKKSTVM